MRDYETICGFFVKIIPQKPDYLPISQEEFVQKTLEAWTYGDEKSKVSAVFRGGTQEWAALWKDESYKVRGAVACRASEEYQLKLVNDPITPVRERLAIYGTDNVRLAFFVWFAYNWARKTTRSITMRYLELGNIVQDISPSFDNPRNSEGAFLETVQDGILFVYSRFRGETAADHAYADLALMRSVDGGRTFQDEGVILTCEGEGGVNMMSPSLLHMANGEIGLIYLVRITYSMTRLFLRRSSDGGRTWGERVLCTPQDDFFVINNDRVLRLSTGRLLLPVASHRSGEGYFDSRSEAMYFYSDDDGQSVARRAI